MMSALAACLLLVLAGAAAAGAAQERGHLALPGSPVAAETGASPVGSAVTRGAPYDLRLDGDTLSYCDSGRSAAIDLRASRAVARTDACPPAGEPNTACERLGIDVEVRAPLSAPDDILDVDGVAIPLKGRVHDCVIDGTLMGVVTGSSVNLVDTASTRMVTVDRAGGDRIVIGPKWVVWSAGNRFRWKPRPKQ